MTILQLLLTALALRQLLVVADASASSKSHVVDLSYQHHLGPDAIARCIRDGVRRVAGDDGEVEVDVSSTLIGDAGCKQLAQIFEDCKDDIEPENAVDVSLYARMNRISAVGASVLFDAIAKIGRTEDVPAAAASDSNSPAAVRQDESIGEIEGNATEGAVPDADVEGATRKDTEPASKGAGSENISPATDDRSDADKAPTGSLYVHTLDMGLNDLCHHQQDSRSSSASSRLFSKSLRTLIEGSSSPAPSNIKEGKTNVSAVCPCPRVLRLDRCGLGPSTCRAIGKGLLNAATSQCNKQQATSQKALRQLQSRRLLCLHLSGNDLIGDSGAAALAAALRTAPRADLNGGDKKQVLPPVLDMLDLSSCGIGDAGAEALAMAMKDNPGCVRRLDLSHNRITDDGAVAIGRALASSAVIRDRNKKGKRSDLKKVTHVMDSIDLSGNKDVGDEGAVAIASAVECGSIMSVYIRSCSVRADGAMAFGKALLAFASSPTSKGESEGHALKMNIDLSGNDLGTLRAKAKSNPYSASLLKSKASATTASYMNFIGKKIKSGLKDAGLDVSQVVGNFLPTGESDDEEEAMMGLEEREDGASKTSLARCGARSFAEPFVVNNIKGKGSVKQAKDDHDYHKRPERKAKCMVGIRQCALDQGAADALAAAIVRGRKHFGLDIVFDSAMNDSLESRAVLALQGEEEEDDLLQEMAKRHVDALEALQIARQRAAEAAKAAAARAKAEQMMSNAFGKEDYSDFGGMPGEEYGDYDFGYNNNGEYDDGY